jgi:hypothetical protein
MQTTISQIFYPDRRAFFAKLALSLPPQPAIKIRPAPLPSGKPRPGCRNMRKAVPTETPSTAQRSVGAKPSILLKPMTRRAHSCKSRVMRTPLPILVLQILAWFAYPWLLALSKISRATLRQKFEASPQLTLWPIVDRHKS